MTGTAESIISDDQKYKSLMYFSMDGVCELDLDGNVVGSNPAFVKMSGYSKNDLLHMTLVKLITTDSHWSEDQLRISADEVVTGLECKLKHKTGKQLYVSLNIIPIYLVDEFIGRYLIVKDITEKKLIRDSYFQLRKMLEHLQRIARVGSWEFDPESGFSSWSTELFNIYGIENTKVIHISKAIEYIHPDDKDRFSRSVNCLSAGEPYDIEFRIIRPDGDMRFLRSKREMLMDEGEVRFIGVVHDLTEQKRTEELLLKSEKLSAIGQLAAGVAHELRNPLTALKGFLKMIPEAENPQRYLEIMENELNRIEKVTNGFLALAKPQIRRFGSIDIGQKLIDVLDLLNTQALMKSIELRMEMKRNISWVECEPQLEQVFINLIKNAIEAAPVGGKVIARISQTDNEEVALEIIDNGPGIPQQYLEKLGEPFFTTKENGTGLGLMISQKIILEHCGRFEIDSEEGKGTTVRIVLPCRQPQK